MAVHCTKDMWFRRSLLRRRLRGGNLEIVVEGVIVGELVVAFETDVDELAAKVEETNVDELGLEGTEDNVEKLLMNVEELLVEVEDDDVDRKTVKTFGDDVDNLEKKMLMTSTLSCWTSLVEQSRTSSKGPMVLASTILPHHYTDTPCQPSSRSRGL